jgi:hypothetical protein
VEESGDSGRGDRNHVDEHNFDEHHDDHHDRAGSGSYSCEFVSRSLSLA